MALQIRRGLEADRTTFIPAQGELLYSTDDQKLYIGDGSTPGGNAVGGGDLVTDTTANQFVHNQHTNIAFTYNSVNGRIIGSVPGLQIAGDDSTVRTVNLGETIKFSGTGGATVTSDSEGNITIDSLTYNVEAIPTGGGAKLRLQSALSLDDITFTGSGGTVITAIDANTIEINTTAFGSGTVNSGLISELAFYAAAGTAVSGASGLTYNSLTGELTYSRANVDAIVTDNSAFAIFNTVNDQITLGGTLDGTEYSGKLLLTDIGPWTPTGLHSVFLSSHNDVLTNLFTFSRQRGTLASPQTLQAGDVIGGLGFNAFDGTDFRQVGNIVFAAIENPVPGKTSVASVFVLQTSNTDTRVVALTVDQNQTLTLFGDLVATKKITNGTVQIENNVINTVVSNANLELNTSGTGSIILNNDFNFNNDGGFKLPILTAAPISPNIGFYVADGTSWDPASKSGAVSYPVYYDGSSFNALY